MEPVLGFTGDNFGKYLHSVYILGLPEASCLALKVYGQADFSIFNYPDKWFFA
jgi:hypothetical protein